MAVSEVSVLLHLATNLLSVALGRHPSVHKMPCPGVKPEPAVMSDKEENRRKEVGVRRKTYLSDVV